jgi:hypothetical protein
MIESEVMKWGFLTIYLSCQAEARAEFAERSVQKLQKEVDRLEGKSHMFIVNLLYWLIETLDTHTEYFLYVTNHKSSLLIIQFIYYINP